MTNRIHTSRPQIPVCCPLLKRQSPARKRLYTLGTFCRQTLLTFKETSSKYKAVGDRKYKLFGPSSEKQQNADPEDLLNF